METRRILPSATWVLGLVASLILHAAPVQATAASGEPSRPFFLGGLPIGRRPPHGFTAPQEAGLLGAALRAPAWLVARIASISVRPRGDGDVARLDRKDGRRVVQFPVHDAGSGVFVRIAGRVEFERADIGFADGPVESVDAFGVGRGSGMYQLAGFEGERPIEWVRLVLRSRSRCARVEVLLAR